MVFRHIVLGVFILGSVPATAQNKIGLPVFLAKVRAENLELKVEKAKLDVVSSKSEGAVIPPPMIGVTRMKDDGLGTVAYGFEIEQTIPFPSKITRDLDTRKFSVGSQQETLRAQEHEVLAKAKLVFIELWTLQEKRKLLLDKKEIVTGHIKLSRSTVRSDSYAGVHLLKAESDLDLLDGELLEVEQDLANKQIDAANLLGLDAANFKMVVEEPPQSQLPKSVAIERTHQVQSSLMTLDGIRSKEREAQSKWYPDFNLRYKQTQATSMSSRTSEIMVGVTLPFIFFGEPAATEKSASAERIQAELELQKQKLDIESDRAKLLSKVKSIVEQLDLIKNQLIPKAEKRMRLVHNLAPRDMETLQDHRETMEALPNLKLKLLALRLDYEAAVTSLEKYIPDSGASS